MDAMETYLGTDVKIDNPYFSKYGPLQQNILREKSIHEWSVWSTGDSTLNVYCDESKLPGIKRTECDQPNTPGLRVTAYTFSDDGLLLAFKYLILCPRFFDTDIKTLEQLTTDARDNHNMTLQTTMVSIFMSLFLRFWLGLRHLALSTVVTWKSISRFSLPEMVANAPTFT